ncbi:MAG: peptidoglycan DD-metalloendopeptidase family protein [Deinococcales bacterium]
MKRLCFLLVGLLGWLGEASANVRPLLEIIALKPPATTVRLEPKRPAASDAIVYYRVRRGDSIGSLANRFGVTTRAIKLATGITKNSVRPGETLKIPLEKSALEPERPARLPPGAFWYTVKRGDTLSGIQDRFNFDLVDLVNANPALRSLDQIYLGDRLLIPGDTAGVYIILKKNQDLLDVAANYGVALDDLIRANARAGAMQFRAGDYLVLPNIDADSRMEQLLERREAEEAIRTQARFELAKKRIAAARATLALQAKNRAAQAAQAAKARERLRASQRRSVASRVRRATATYSFPSYGGGYIWPMRGSITSGFGRRAFWIGGSNFHTGLDIAAPYGTPIYAAKGGYVQESGYGYFGLNIWINTGAGVQNIYGHMSRTAVYAGQYVQRGQLIGWEGCSGICTGPHLHFEIRVNGSPVNPLRYLP